MIGATARVAYTAVPIELSEMATPTAIGPSHANATMRPNGEHAGDELELRELL